MGVAGRRNGQADVFGKRVTVREVAERYKAPWSPGVFWPRDAFMHTKKTDQGSPSSRLCGPFLTGWFICWPFTSSLRAPSPPLRCSGEAHLRPCASPPLLPVAVWPVLFRIGSRSERDPEPADDAESNNNTNVNNNTNNNTNIINLTLNGLFGPPYQSEDGGGAKSKPITVNNTTTNNTVVKQTTPLTGPPHSKTKEAFPGSRLWCCSSPPSWPPGSALIQAWTLPGPQWHALSGPRLRPLCRLAAVCRGAQPAHRHQLQQLSIGHVAVARDATEYTHRGSLWPPLISLIISLIAVLIPDPAIPLPMLIAIFLFTPRQSRTWPRRPSVC